MKIIGTGLSGLVGSRIVELLNDQHEFTSLSTETRIDITDKDAVYKAISQSNAPVVFHFAAKTHVDGCELDKTIDKQILEEEKISGEKVWKNKNTAWAINVFGTKNVVSACEATQKKLIYISTDFVFDGEKRDGYIEEDTPNPINWYAQTKYEGEKIVQQMHMPWVIMRIASPYRANFERSDFARSIITKLKQKESVLGITDHIFTPTFIDDIAVAVGTILNKEYQGIINVVGSKWLTPFEAAQIVAKTFDLDSLLVKKTTREQYFKNKASRPFCLAMKNDKMQELGVGMHSFEEGLEIFKTQL